MVANLQSDDLYGVPMTVEAFEHLLNVESPYRYELIDGVICDMTGSTPEHADLAYNITESLKDQLGKRGPCRVYQRLYVAIPGNPSVVPDVVVSCDVADWDKQKRLKPFRSGSPLIVVEVLSASTEKYDRGEKFGRYQCCPTLEVYILVSQDEKHVEVYRRAKGWKQERFGAERTIKLEQLDLELPMGAMYEGVL
jgi:Uma2 family endonuclease